MIYSHDPRDVDAETKELAKQLLRTANGMSSSDIRLADLALLIATDHRTLQQVVMRQFVVPLLSYWEEAANSGRFDARNEATVNAARVMLESARSNDALRFPFI